MTFDQEQIARICHRRFGIGADGFILLRPHVELDFEMVYYNSDGRTSSMCGNGGRCIAQFAYDQGLVSEQMQFMAIDGPHAAEIINGEVRLKMQDVTNIEVRSEAHFVDTGSPHHVVFGPDPAHLALVEEARKIRYAPPYEEAGVNVNFACWQDQGVTMRTYERGVEDETYSCGTGVTAAALVAYHQGLTPQSSVPVHTKGGDLRVDFKAQAGHFSDIWLQGPAQSVFSGKYPRQ